MNWAPALSNPHIVSIQWCSEARGHSMVGAGVHNLCIPQRVFSTLGHTVRAQFSSPWLHPLPSLPTHPPTTALSSTGWKVIIPAELVVPWLRLRYGEAWPASQTLFASVPTSSKPVYTSCSLYKCVAGKIHGLPIAELQSSITLALIWLSQFLQSTRKRTGERLGALCLVPSRAFICGCNLISLSCITEGLKWRPR